MKWASSISTQPTIEQCIEETTSAIREQLEGLETHLTVLFVSPHFKGKYDLIPRMLSERMNAGLLLGCSASGIIGGGREVEHKPAFSITCAHLPNVEIQTIQSDTLNLPDPGTANIWTTSLKKWRSGLVKYLGRFKILWGFKNKYDDEVPAMQSDTLNLPDPGTAASVWREWLGVDVEKNPQFILMAEPLSFLRGNLKGTAFRGEEFLSGLDFAYPNAPKIGGLASGTNSPGGNALYLGDKIFNRGLVGVALTGDIQLDTIVARGCHPIGKPMSITQCETTLLQQVDGKPVVEVFDEMIETLSESDRRQLKTALFLGIEMDPMKDDPGQGNFLIRNINHVKRISGALDISAILRNGQRVQFHLRDKVMSAEDLNGMLSKYTEKGQSDQVQGALLFSCLGRGEDLYGTPNHDSDVFKSKLGDVPLGGFFCNGEIGPVGKATFLHALTSSFGIFRPGRAQP